MRFLLLLLLVCRIYLRSDEAIEGLMGIRYDEEAKVGLDEENDL